jgi:hypothetical protein
MNFIVKIKILEEFLFPTANCMNKYISDTVLLWTVFMSQVNKATNFNVSWCNLFYTKCYSNWETNLFFCCHLTVGISCTLLILSLSHNLKKLKTCSYNHQHSSLPVLTQCLKNDCNYSDIPKRSSLNFPKNLNFVNWRAITDTLYINVHVVCIAKDKIYICTYNLNLSKILRLQKSSKLGQSSKQQGRPQFYAKQFVFNFELIVFYSEQRYITQYAIATNWNTTGYFETSHPKSKYSVKSLTNNFMVSRGQCND